MAVRVTAAGVALVAGIIVVIALIVGGFFWARQAAEQARRDEATQIAEEQLEQDSNEEVALNEGGENTDENAEETADEGASENGEQENASETGALPGTGADAPAGEEVSELPQTGPADSVGTVLAAGGVTFAAVAYVSSRRKLHDLQ